MQCKSTSKPTKLSRCIMVVKVSRSSTAEGLILKSIATAAEVCLNPKNAPRHDVQPTAACGLHETAANSTAAKHCSKQHSQLQICPCCVLQTNAHTCVLNMRPAPFTACQPPFTQRAMLKLRGSRVVSTPYSSFILQAAPANNQQQQPGATTIQNYCTTQSSYCESPWLHSRRMENDRD